MVCEARGEEMTQQRHSEAVLGFVLCCCFILLQKEHDTERGQWHENTSTGFQ